MSVLKAAFSDGECCLYEFQFMHRTIHKTMSEVASQGQEDFLPQIRSRDSA